MIYLTQLEDNIIRALDAAGGRLVHPRLLCDQVGIATDRSGTAALRIHISRLRRKLGPKAIKTVPTRGYALGNVRACRHCSGTGYVVVLGTEVA